MSRWQPGDHVVHRLVGAGHGQLWGRPAVVVRDDETLTALYHPAGSATVRLDMRSGFTALETLTNPLHLLRLIGAPPRRYSVLLFFDAGNGVPPFWPWLANEGHCRGWKVDVEAPAVRTSIGFDATDNSLDLVRVPGGEWAWKDEDHTERLRLEGVFSDGEVESFYASGREAIEACQRGDVLFEPAWEWWQPDASWTAPSMPDGWWLEPGAETNMNHGRHFTWRWPR